jgi:hypothetical protein
MKKTAAIAAGALVLLGAFVQPARASSKLLWWSNDTYTPIAQTISGVPDLVSLFEDDSGEWTLLTGTDCSPGGECALGFTNPFAVPGQVATCNGTGCYWYPNSPGACPPVGGICIAVYHRTYFFPGVTQAFFGAIPVPTPTFQPIWIRLQNGTQDPYQAAIAILTFIHESYHNRLQSGDEQQVNACALQDFPYWLKTAFQIPDTITQTVMVSQPQQQQKRIRYYQRVRVVHHRRDAKGHLVTWYTYRKVVRYKTVTVTVTVQVPEQQTVPNPLYQTLVADAIDFRTNHQPPPYNDGPCTTPTGVPSS